jgi:hypothetical protein
VEKLRAARAAGGSVRVVAKKLGLSVGVVQKFSAGAPA